MNDLPVEIAATSEWLEEHGAAGAATVLRRVARQRDEALARLATEGTQPAAGAADFERPRSGQMDSASTREPDIARDSALMRIELARFQNLVERAGWLPDAEPRRLWRWRDGWWELSHRKRNAKDGFHDTGWYLWGPSEGCFSVWTAPAKSDAIVEADRLITRHLATRTEVIR